MEVYSNGLKKSFSIEWPFCFINMMGEKNQWWGWGLDKEIPGLFSDYLSLMLGKPRIRLNNLKTSLRFPCLGLNPIIDSIILDGSSSLRWYSKQSQRARSILLDGTTSLKLYWKTSENPCHIKKYGTVHLETGVVATFLFALIEKASLKWGPLPIALRKAIIVCNFGLSECSWVKQKNLLLLEKILFFESWP